MKLYIWTDVLRDYTSGMIVLYANSRDECRALCEKEFPGRAEDFSEFANGDNLRECASTRDKGEPRILEYMYGGG